MLRGDNGGTAFVQFGFRWKSEKDPGGQRNHRGNRRRICILAVTEGTIVQYPVHLLKIVDGGIFDVDLGPMHSSSQFGSVVVHIFQVILGTQLEHSLYIIS